MEWTKQEILNDLDVAVELEKKYKNPKTAVIVADYLYGGLLEGIRDYLKTHRCYKIRKD